jgi:hypothetical protein
VDAVEPDIPPAILAELRAICLGLPETHEEPAWVGTRWQVRKRTFAHVFRVDEQSPPILARIADGAGALTALVFRSQGDELDWLRRAGPPYFSAGWGRDAVGLVLTERSDWGEVAELLTESYCTKAPKKLQAMVDRPDA